MAVNFSPETTGIGPYARAYADLLHERGHEVSVITGLPHYPRWRRGKEAIEQLPYRVERCWHYIPARPTSWRRMLYELTFAASVVPKIARLPRQDVVVAITPALAATFVASFVGPARGAGVVIIVQDVVSAAAQQTGGPGFLVLASRFVERASFARADAIGVIHDAMRRATSLRGAQQKIALTPNWPLSAHDRFPTRESARQRLGFGSGDFVCVHSGNIGAKQGLEVIVDAARKLLPERAFRFVLVGDGNRRQQIETRAVGLANLEMRPLVPNEQFLDILAGADALLLCQHPSVREMSFPGKLVAYMRSGSPIVASVAAESATGITVSETGAGILTPPGDADALAVALRSLRDEPDTGRRAVAAAARYSVTELDPQILKRRFVDLVESVGHQHRST